LNIPVQRKRAMDKASSSKGVAEMKEGIRFQVLSGFISA
jgi:hypothetical protein